jgi:molybdopterin synthase sulfur carrier subunit
MTVLPRYAAQDHKSGRAFEAIGRGNALAVQVHVTSVIQKAVDGQRQLDVDGATVAEVIENLESRYPGFRDQIMDSQGQLHRFVNIYLNDEDIRYLKGADTELSDGDQVSILPALAGGSPSEA